MFEDELVLSSKLPLTHGAFIYCYGGCIGTGASAAIDDDNQAAAATTTGQDFILFERCTSSLSVYLQYRYQNLEPPSPGCPFTSQPLQLQEVLSVGISLFSALAYIHPRGTTHGDLSSGNVLVKRQSYADGADYMSVVLTDFGTARVRRRHCADKQTAEERLARGTANFMPPLDAEEPMQASTEPLEHDRMFIVRSLLPPTSASPSFLPLLCCVPCAYCQPRFKGP